MVEVYKVGWMSQALKTFKSRKEIERINIHAKGPLKKRMAKRVKIIIDSNNPWKHKIIRQLGKAPKAGAAFVPERYEIVQSPRSASFWDGIPRYGPEIDQFFTASLRY